MSGKQYLKNQLPVILINLLGMLVLALFLIASDNPIQTVLFIFCSLVDCPCFIFAGILFLTKKISE